MKEYLFGCDEGENRSPTGARVLREMVSEKGPCIKTDYFGFDVLPRGRGVGERLRSAKLLFVMSEKRRMDAIEKYKVPGKRVVNLEIPDEYRIHGGLADAQMERMLEEVFRTKLEPYVDEICRVSH